MEFDPWAISEAINNSVSHYLWTRLAIDLIQGIFGLLALSGIAGGLGVAGVIIWRATADAPTEKE